MKTVMHWFQPFDWSIRLRKWLGIPLYTLRTVWYEDRLINKNGLVHLAMFRVRQIGPHSESLQVLSSSQFNLEELKEFRNTVDQAIERLEIKAKWKGEDNGEDIS